jgi:hypothetical protein
MTSGIVDGFDLSLHCHFCTPHKLGSLRQTEREMKKISTPELTRSLPTATCLITRFKSRRETVGRRCNTRDDTDVGTEMQTVQQSGRIPQTRNPQCRQHTHSTGCLHSVHQVGKGTHRTQRDTNSFSKTLCE